MFSSPFCIHTPLSSSVAEKKKKMAEQGPKVGDARSLWNFTPSPGTRLFVSSLFAFRFSGGATRSRAVKSFCACTYTHTRFVVFCVLKIFEIFSSPTTRTARVFLFPVRVFARSFSVRPFVALSFSRSLCLFSLSARVFSTRCDEQ